jgi:ankyrin repeat protein
MKNIKTYELFFGNKITKSLLKEIENIGLSDLIISIKNNNYKDFEKIIKKIKNTNDNIIELKNNIEKLKNNSNKNAEEMLEQYETFLRTFKKIKDHVIEIPDFYGNTPLLIAAKEGRVKMMKDLIDVDANMYHINKEGENFYDVAVNRYKFINGAKDWIEKNYPEYINANKYNI